MNELTPEERLENYNENLKELSSSFETLVRFLHENSQYEPRVEMDGMTFYVKAHESGAVALYTEGTSKLITAIVGQLWFRHVGKEVTLASLGAAMNVSPALLKRISGVLPTSTGEDGHVAA
jgi:hypothetical protein